MAVLRRSFEIGQRLVHTEEKNQQLAIDPDYQGGGGNDQNTRRRLTTPYSNQSSNDRCCYAYPENDLDKHWRVHFTKGQEVAHGVLSFSFSVILYAVQLTFCRHKG